MSLAPLPAARQPRPDDALFAKRRAAIDLLATSRARAIRSALFGSYLLRPHPTKPESEETRTQWRAILQEQCDALERASILVKGSDPLDQVPKDICDWIGARGADLPEQTAAFERMHNLTRAVVDAASRDDVGALDAALQAHFAFGRGGFFESVSEFCDDLWSALDAARDREMKKAAATGGAIATTLTRLEQIGRHVRLVSLNASVEAARVGDAGRGLGVIAVEFKTLAEEIQHLSCREHSELSGVGNMPIVRFS
ncbi:methyl-accepting chemotaxis protein [Tateyamaria sp.]|uniref:methyl-accepting chemotaxis protein n=1 Tax=Tateyamaria sp. TaxID=1929288 RepID=UPI003B222A0C